CARWLPTLPLDYW
nr:immunoglobulin heavy chain junction region [Mus musculus]